MRLRNIPRSEEVLTGSPYVVQEPAAVKGSWREQFKKTEGIKDLPSGGSDAAGTGAGAYADAVADNDKDRKRLELEIGTGKGRFIMEMASRNPDILYVGIEKFSSVLLRVEEKQQEQMLDTASK